MTNFIRQVQLFIGPLSEVQTPNTPNSALVLSSTGQDDELNINFQVEKNTMGTPNVCSIDIFNLSSATRQTISKVQTNFILQAGYLEGNLPLQTIAKGAIAATISSREGPNTRLTIKALDGAQGMGLGKFSKSYQKNIALSTIVKDVAQSIPGTEVDASNINIGTYQVGSGGLSLAGRSKDILDKLARQWGFDWSVQNRVFKAISDESSSGNTYQISSQLGNLLHITPRIDNVLQIVTGVDILAVLDPRLQPYDKIQVVSTVAPELNNTYKITNLTHTGQIRDNVWTTQLQCLFTLDQITAGGST